MLVLLGLLSSLAVVLHAQTAQITGRVSDSTGAVIVGAKVAVSNTETGVSREIQSNEDGYYTAPLLARGQYSIHVIQAGFKELIRNGLTLDEGQTMRLDFTLDVGAVSEKIEVSGAAPLLETERPTVSTVIPSQKILDMPTVGRNPLQFALLVPGVRAVGSFGDLPVSAYGGGRASIAGGAVSANNYMVDGIASENFTSGSLQTPLSVDATEEFRLIVRNPSAEYGRTGGGIINLISRAGTNDFHGSLYEFHRNKVLRANDFFSNRAGRARSPLVFNQWGGTVGGPIKKDKTFFFFNYEQFKQRTLATATRTVPTDLQRLGDFSQTLTSAGAVVQIYDPYSTRTDPANPANRLRDQFPGNRIPGSRVSATAQAVSAFYPKANTTGVFNTNANNFFGQASSPIDKDIYGLRLDHYLNSTRRIAGRYTWDKTTQGVPNFYDNVAEIQTSDLPLQRHSAFISFSDAFGSNLLFDARAGLNFYLPNRVTRSFGFDVTTIGMASRLNGLMQIPSFPRFDMSDMTSIGADQGDQLVQSNKAFSYLGSLTWIRGTHTWKFGSENRVYQLNNTQGAAGMSFSFSRGFTQGPNPNTSGAASGFGFASYMLGTPGSGTVSFNAPTTETVKNYALYAQDDWKVTPTLTLNLGLRWEYEGGITDRFGAISNFDPAVKSSINGLTLTGGLAFPGVNGLDRGHRDAEYSNLQPRFGFAWQVIPKTVIRGGYSISYLPTSGIYTGLDRTGFSLGTPLVSSVDGGFTPNETLANPFPDGKLAPIGSSQGALSLLGQSVSGNLRKLARGYSQQWGLSAQREFRGSWLVEAGYMGNRGVRLPGRRTFDYLPQQYRALGTQLQQLVDNPYYGTIASNLSLGQKQVTLATLLDTYPQFSGAGGYATMADSIYHAATLRVEKRFSQGLSLLTAYTFSKLIDNNQGGGGNSSFVESGDEGVRNWDNLAAERAVSSNDLPQRLVISGSYELPFGKTGPAVLKQIVGGWQFNAITTFQSGNVISVSQNSTSFGSSKPNVAGDPSLSNPTIDMWLNKAAFVDSPAFTFGNVARNLPRTRTDGWNNIDLSLLKGFTVRERYKFQFRAEAFNFTNTPTFGNPGTNIDAGSFGSITSVAAGTAPRTIQLGLKLYF
ncbi:TonB-dependent receptor domain-containing protein [uncultured Paludibaculum sp.]|uniref:TonB-dependent receptor domain-containing protein n=1 Tax=uncultured Paludibaculum sp. TaxID=1765020 RepID=UPI002AAAFDD1|nr:TonB-dependent receptor [uncultured Paludibaculum sp.]